MKSSVLTVENLWAVEVDSEEFSEAIQRIAFSFGYTWYGEIEPKYKNAKYLCFNPLTKYITYCSDTNYVVGKGIPIYNTVYAAMEIFQNPPEKRLILFGGDVKVSQNGDVTFHKDQFTSEEFKQIVDERSKFLYNS